MAATSPVLTAIQSSSVLGKRKVSQISSYVLHLASSPEPLAGPSDSEFEFLSKPSCNNLIQLPAPVPKKPILVNGKLVASDTKKRYQCIFDGCDKSYTKPSRLEEHERSHTGQRPFVCNACNKSYLRETHLQAHARSHLPYAEKPLLCPISECAKRFWTNQHLRAHVNWHNGAKPFKCTQPDCDEAFAKHHQLRSHLCTAHAPPGTKPYQCSHEGCTKSFSTNQHLRTHLRVHNDKRYTCVQTDCLPTPDRPAVFYQTWTALQHHIRTAHPPTCTHPSCNGRSFASQKGLRAHQKLHQQRDEEAQLDALRSDDEEDESDQPPRKKRRGGEYGRDWKCKVDGCEKDFKSSKALMVHNKVTHLGRRDFVCPHESCSRAFGYKHLLQRHLAKLHQTHSGSGHSSFEHDGNDDADSESSDSESPVHKNISSMLSIDAITGSAYAARAKERGQSGKALRCPYPHHSDIKIISCAMQGAAESGPSTNSHEGLSDAADCDYFFSRAYDLRRHLRAVHEVEAGKESVDVWVAVQKNRSRG